MKDGRILLVNLSKGKLGEANSAFLGSVVVAKLVVAVFARAAIPPAKRKPFHIIVDEFQNFTISSFPGLLSEGRKFNVDLVIAHQYREQLRDWVQGATVNAGNIVCFRVGGDDALELAHEFDATPPPPEYEYRSRYALTTGIKVIVDSERHFMATESKMVQSALAKSMAGSPLDADTIERMGWWTARVNRYLSEATPQEAATILGEPDPATAAEMVTALTEFLQSLRPPEQPRTTPVLMMACERIHQHFKRVREHEQAYVQERGAYPAVIPAYSDPERRSEWPRILHKALSSAERTLYDRVPGRARLYSDMYSQIANELTHLPNFVTMCRLAGSADPIIEQSSRTIEWPKDHEDSAKREELYDRNLKAVEDNTHRDFTRPRSEVARDFKKRYELMLRSIGMSWAQDEPLPKPQVLYEDDD